MLEKLDENTQNGKNESYNLPKLFTDHPRQYYELMMMYSCAIREIQTKLEILNDELSIRYQRNPISFIKTRTKSPDSILKKLLAKKCEISLTSIQENLSDVAGIRVICPFIDDIYEIARMLTNQDDITTIKTKDYIQNPKPNGYRSLHLIVEVPVFLSDRKQYMKVEVQIRTIAMDFWASLDHQLRYKKNLTNADIISAELKECADTISATDQKMQNIKYQIYGY